MATGGRLLELVDGCLSDERAELLIVDLSQVSFLDCSGISYLLTGRRAAVQRGCGFMVADPGPHIRRVLRLTGVLDVLLPDRARGR